MCTYGIRTVTRGYRYFRLKIIIYAPAVLVTLLSCLSFRSVCLWDRDALLAAIVDRWENEVALRLASRKQGLLPLNYHAKSIKR